MADYYKLSKVSKMEIIELDWYLGSNFCLKFSWISADSKNQSPKQPRNAVCM